MNNGHSPINITAAHSLNRVIVSDAPGLPESLQGLTGWQLLSAQTHRELVTARGEKEAARELGDRLGWFVAILRTGHEQNRQAREEWDDSHWALWAGIQRIVLGGGLVSGPEAPLMLEAAQSRLKALGQTCTLERARNPQHLPLIGACRFFEDSIHSRRTNKTAEKTTQRTQTVVLDFGGSFLKRGRLTCGGTELSKLELLDALPVDFESLSPHELLSAMARATAATIQEASPSWTGELIVPVSIAAYVDNEGQPLLSQQGVYMRLGRLEGNAGMLLSKAVSKICGQAVHTQLIHDGSAAARAFGSAVPAAVIMLGTALGIGFPVDEEDYQLA